VVRSGVQPIYNASFPSNAFTMACRIEPLVFFSVNRIKFFYHRFFSAGIQIFVPSEGLFHSCAPTREEIKLQEKRLPALEISQLLTPSIADSRTE
jgi:hypothetical protein